MSTDQSRMVKAGIAYIILVITAYGMIDGLMCPDDMAFVRAPGSVVDLQPDSFILQFCSWLFEFIINILSAIYLFEKLKSIA